MIAFSLEPPIKTLSGFSRSLIAVPSAKNSGLDNTSNVGELLFFIPSGDVDSNISFITSAVLTGKVLFSTIIV